MSQFVRLTLVFAFLSGCAVKETQIKEALKKDPKLVFDVIEENPEQFIDVVNRAAQKAQMKQMEKQSASMKQELENDLKNPKHPKLDPKRRLTGSDSGKITVVEYADFQCPACGMAYESLKEFKTKHAGEVQFYFKHMPLDFHKMARPAARYFEAVSMQDPSKAARFYDLLFENQQNMKDEKFLKLMAQQVGARQGQLEKDLASGTVDQKIKEDIAEFDSFKFTGTPVVILNGVALNGAQPIEELERISRLTTR